MGDAGTLSVLAQDTLTGAGVQTITGAKTFNDQKLKRKNPAGTFTLTEVHPAITSDQNHYMNMPYSFIIFKLGSTYYAQNCVTGGIESGATSSTDASIPINYAINNIPGAAARDLGGKIFITAGKYDCKTGIALNFSTTTYNAIELEGEGHATFLDFTPSTTLTEAILLRVRSPGLSNLRIRGNANVTNLVVTRGLGVGNEPSIHFGYINHVKFDGAAVPDSNAPPDAAPTTGQTGFYMNGDPNNRSTYFWKITNCDFSGLDMGMHLFDYNATSTFQSNNCFLTCEEGERIGGGQHNINNIWVQGALNVGKYGLHLLRETGNGTAAKINISNVVAELPKTGTVTAAVYNEQVLDVRLANIHNNSTLGVHVLDDSNYRSVIDLERSYPQLPSTTINNVGWFTGQSAPGIGSGICMGRIADFGPVITSVDGPDGMRRSMITGSAINTVMGTIFTGDFILRTANPEFRTMTLISNATAIRIFIGFINVHDPTTIVSTSDILNTPRKGCGFWLDSAVSANWKAMSNSGTGASTIADLSTPTAATTATPGRFKIITDNTNSKFTLHYSEINSTVVVKTDITSDIPVSSDDLSFLIYFENTAASSKTMRVHYGELRLTK